MARLRIGTCSWKFPSWAGLVYSAPRGIDYLAEYASRFDTVEIDQWFWSYFGADNIKLPDSATVAGYRAAVPDDFRFTVKAPNSLTLTHGYPRRKSDALQPNPWFLSAALHHSFLSTLDPLHDVLGVVIFQFGYLNRQMIPSQSHFEARLEAFAAQLPEGYEYGVEVRNPNYLNASFFELLQRLDLAPVLLQGYYMPSVLEVYHENRAGILDRRLAVVRLHGPDREGMEDRTGKRWDRILVARDSELAGIVEMVEELLGRGLDVYVNVNNHYEGSAPLTIERITKLLRADA